MNDRRALDYGQHDEPDDTERRLAEATEEADVRWFMADPRGRRVVRRLLDRAGVFRSSYTGESLGTAFREGERNVGLGLLALVLAHAPEASVEILTGKGTYEPRD